MIGSEHLVRAAPLADANVASGTTTQLEDLKTQLDLLREVVTLGRWVVEPGENPTVYLSSELMEMLALSEVELKQEPDCFWLRVHPEDRTRLFDAAQRATFRGCALDLEHRVVLPGGRVRWLRVRGLPRTASSCRCFRVVGMALDVTAQKSIQQSLTLAENRIASIAEASRDGVLVLQAVRNSRGEIEDFVALELNERAAGFLSGSVRQLRGLSLHEFFPEDHARVAFAKCSQMVESQTPYQEISPGLALGLAPKWLRWRAVPREDNIVVAVSDVGWEEELSKQVAHASRLESIGSLAVGIAHDFNNMLSAIVGFSELVREELSHDSPLYADLGQVLSAAERASRLTRYLLAFGRRQPLEPELVEVTGLFDELSPILARLAGPAVTLEMEHPKRLHILVDPSQFEQVIVNLVVNARDAMPDGGNLTISSGTVDFEDERSALAHECSPGKYAYLSFQDDGIGMDEQVRARVFEPFFTTKGDQGGTGLGLASAYGFVRQSGGAILVDSTLGRGTTFRVYFPLARAVGRADVAPSLEPRRLSILDSATILVVENDDAVREVACRILETRGYHVLRSHCPDEAEALLANRAMPVDVLLVALGLPQGGGLAFARRVKSVANETRILLMSGAAEYEKLEDAMNQLGATFVPKPLSATLLVAKVAEALRSAKGPSTVPADAGIAP